MKRFAFAARRAVALLVLAAALLAPAAAAAVVVPRASLTDIEDEVMCISCRIPLNVAESAQADGERRLIRGLVARGLTKDQIKHELVRQLGDNVLALPRQSGFGLTAFAVPLALVVGLGAGLALLLPRWRRRTPTGIGDGGAAELSDADAQRLDAELARYPR